jgi:hypothetical protein
MNVVVVSLNCLRKTCEYGEKYWYSCGANFTFQLTDRSELGRPAGMLSIKEICNLGRLKDAPIEVPMYQYFIQSAFGKTKKHESWRARLRK